MKKLMMMVLVLSWVMPLRAELSGEELLRGCNFLVKLEMGVDVNHVNNTDIGIAMGYVNAMHEFCRYEEKMGVAGAIVLPKEVTTMQLVRVVRSYLAKNPKLLHKRAFELVLVAFEGL